jgi:hypothetical protein
MALRLGRHILGLAANTNSTANFGDSVGSGFPGGSSTPVDGSEDTSFWPSEAAGLAVCGLFAWLAACISIYQVRVGRFCEACAVCCRTALDSRG